MSVNADIRAILKTIVENHGVEFLELGDDLFASFGDRLTIEITPNEAEILKEIQDA
jgi:hypothetical protein